MQDLDSILSLIGNRFHRVLTRVVFLVEWSYDLWSLVKPRQAELQIPRNVHFQAKGSSVMAKQVAERIRAALAKAGN